mgnify:CR=1 FL=1
MSLVQLPTTWQSLCKYMLHGGDFVVLPQGGGAQLRRSAKASDSSTLPKTISLMFNQRPAITFYEDDVQLLIHGPIHATPLKGVLRYVNSALLVHSRIRSHAFRVMRYRDNSAVLLRIPSEDPGKPEGDPYRLDNRHSIMVFPRDGTVKGTSWRPFGCAGTDVCACSYCKAIQARRMDAIARAIAGDLELWRGE